MKVKSNILLVILGLFMLPLTIDLHVEAGNDLIERYQKPKNNKMEVHFVDSINGEASIIITPENKVILIDSGSKYSSDKLVEYLKQLDVLEIHTLLISNPYSSYIGGVPDIVNNFHVKRVIDPGTALQTDTFKKYLSSVRKKVDTHKVGRAGDCIYETDNLTLKAIYPSRAKFNDVRDNSLVILLKYKDISFLFTGALGKEGLLDLEVPTNINILKVSRMGDKKGTSDNFLDLVSPQIAVIMGGSDNPLNLPDQDLMHSLRKRGIHIERTGQTGNMNFKTDGKKVDWNL
ncbi:ComEC/Rec2 family competence protein [Natranaerobius trueperi]|uniref:Metallo-beta-lactamase domain-containing protein n=1 Tax=Natranaerobius trueperi TaxID=759412 RepID=A0A226BVX3_9FIRM|nr:MBL fold metallo-hydrolase [Natranaerobius trueperi]OWZ82932.1 hypothetical protein CDO51_11450 [Natranaerobius trueperi]